MPEKSKMTDSQKELMEIALAQGRDQYKERVRSEENIFVKIEA